MSTNVADLHDAEDFFLFFEVPYDSSIVAVKRIPILKLFRRYLNEAGIEDLAFGEEGPAKEEARKCLIRAYEEVISPEPVSSDCVPNRSSKCSSCGGGCG